MAKNTVALTLEGIEDLKGLFQEMPRAVRRDVLWRVLKRPADRIAKAAAAKAPIRTTERTVRGRKIPPGGLRRSIKVRKVSEASQASKAAFANTLAGGGSRSEARGAARTAASSAGAGVTAFIGPDRRPNAHMVEFGSINNTPQPYLRPAWDAERDHILPSMAADLWLEISKVAARRFKKFVRTIQAR
jgi:hypothetical protein